MEKMNLDEQKVLFGQMCYEVFERKMDEELAASKESDYVPPEFDAKMRKLLGIDAEPSIQPKHKSRKLLSPKQIIILVAAAALLLSACASLVYREEIKGFFVEFYEKYFVVMGDNPNESSIIEDVYVLGYVPDGFELTVELILPARVKYEWTNDDNKNITYTQSGVYINGNFDGDNISKIHIKDVEYELAYIETKVADFYMWYDGKYYNMIKSEVKLKDDEVVKIINGIHIDK